MTLRFKGNMKTAGTLKGNAGSAVPETLLGMIESLGLDNADLMVVLDGNDPNSFNDYSTTEQWLNVAPGADTASWTASGNGASVVVDGKGNNVLLLGTPDTATKFIPSDDTTWQRTLGAALKGNDGAGFTVIAIGSRTQAYPTSNWCTWWTNWDNSAGSTGVHSFEGTQLGVYSSVGMYNSGSEFVVANPGFPTTNDIHFAGWTFSKETNQAGAWHNGNRISTGTFNKGYVTSAGTFHIGGMPGGNWSPRQYQFNAFAVWRNEITEQNILDLYALLSARIA